MFDNYVRSKRSSLRHQVVGLRYFNVYGPNEWHKGQMASTIHHFANQIEETGVCKLFGRNAEFDDGMQSRDFIHVNDCVNANVWFFQNKHVTGLYNLGTGTERTFNDVAETIIEWFKSEKDINGSIEYIEFPEALKNSYQNFTKADLTALKKAGYNYTTRSLEVGIQDFLRQTRL